MNGIRAALERYTGGQLTAVPVDPGCGLLILPVLGLLFGPHVELALLLPISTLPVQALTHWFSTKKEVEAVFF